MHAHGCNIQLVVPQRSIAVTWSSCPAVIDEPILPPPGMHWIHWLVDYLLKRGFTVEPFA